LLRARSLPPGKGEALLAKAVHTMIRVFDLDASIDFYKKALDLDVADRFDFEGFTLVYLRNGENDFEIELTHNHGQDRPYTHGDGYGHIAVAVDDLDSENARFAGLGLNPQPIKEFNRDGALMARFFFVQDPDGYKIEVLQKHGRYR
jgi:lactoylglutathione lyase